MLHTKYQGTRHCRFRQEDLVCFSNIKVKQRAKPRSQYNQVPQLTRYIIRDSDKIQENTTHKRAKGSALPSRWSHAYVKYVTSRNVPLKPQGFNLNRFRGGLLGYATYQILKLWALWFLARRFSFWKSILAHVTKICNWLNYLNNSLRGS